MFAKLRIINKSTMKKIGQKWTKLQHTDYQIVVLHIYDIKVKLFGSPLHIKKLFVHAYTLMRE